MKHGNDQRTIFTNVKLLSTQYGLSLPIPNMLNPRNLKKEPGANFAENKIWPGPEFDFPRWPLGPRPTARHLSLLRSDTLCVTGFMCDDVTLS